MSKSLSFSSMALVSAFALAIGFSPLQPSAMAQSAISAPVNVRAAAEPLNTSQRREVDNYADQMAINLKVGSPESRANTRKKLIAEFNHPSTGLYYSQRLSNGLYDTVSEQMKSESLTEVLEGLMMAAHMNDMRILEDFQALAASDNSAVQYWLAKSIKQVSAQVSEDADKEALLATINTLLEKTEQEEVRGLAVVATATLGTLDAARDRTFELLAARAEAHAADIGLSYAADAEAMDQLLRHIQIGDFENAEQQQPLVQYLKMCAVFFEQTVAQAQHEDMPKQHRESIKLVARRAEFQLQQNVSQFTDEPLPKEADSDITLSNWSSLRAPAAMWSGIVLAEGFGQAAE